MADQRNPNQGQGHEWNQGGKQQGNKPGQQQGGGGQQRPNQNPNDRTRGQGDRQSDENIDRE